MILLTNSIENPWLDALLIVAILILTLAFQTNIFEDLIKAWKYRGHQNQKRENK